MKFLQSKRVWLGIAAGMTMLIIAGLLRATCINMLLGIGVAGYVAKVASPKQGAAVGAIVSLPEVVLVLLQEWAELMYGLTHFPLTLAVELPLLVVLFAVIGAGVGALMGLVFRALEKQQVVF